MIKLATSDSAVQGGAGNLTLTDKDGNVISDGVVADIEQNGDVVAKGTYDYRLTGGENDDGLYINYGLTQVELLASGSNALVLDANGKQVMPLTSAPASPVQETRLRQCQRPDRVTFQYG